MGLGDIFSGLFGGDSKKKSNLSDEQEQVSAALRDAMLEDQTQVWLDKKLAKLKKSGKTGKELKQAEAKLRAQAEERGEEFKLRGAEGYEGKLVADMPAWFKKAVMKTLKEKTLPGSYSNQALKQALSGQPAYSVDQQATEDYYRQGLVAPAMQAWEQDIAPRLREAYAGPGGFLTSRQADMEAQQLGNLTTGLNAEMARAVQMNQTLEAQLADSARARQLQAVGQAQQASMLPVTRALALQQAMAPFYENTQAKLGANYNEWLRTQPQNNPYLQAALGYLNTNQVMREQQPGIINRIGGAVNDTFGIMRGASNIGGWIQQRMT